MDTLAGRFESAGQQRCRRDQVVLPRRHNAHEGIHKDGAGVKGVAHKLHAAAFVANGQRGALRFHVAKVAVVPVDGGQLRAARHAWGEGGGAA